MHELWRTKKIDVRLAERTTATVGPHRTPVSSILKKKQKQKKHYNGAMDNFGHEENTVW